MSDAASIYEGPAGTIPVVNVDGNLFEEVQVAAAAQVLFTLLTFEYTPGTNSINVYRKSAGALGGELLRRGVDYTETDTTSITVTVPATLGDLYFFQAYAIAQVTPPVTLNGIPEGGTAGQVLAKINGSDYNTEWVDAESITGLLDALRVNVASGPTVDLTSVTNTTRNLQITGVTQIDGFIIPAGELYAVRFAGILTLANSVNLVTQRNENITTAAGATCFIRATADNVVEVLAYSEPYAKAKIQGDITQDFAADDLNVNSTNTGFVGGLRNRIDNGAMQVWQQQVTFAGPAGVVITRTADRFFMVSLAFGTAVTTTTKQVTGPNSSLPNCIRVATTTAQVAGVNNYRHIRQDISGYSLVDLLNTPFTVSFWVKSPKVGLHTIGFINGQQTFSMACGYQVNIANTWEFKTIVVPLGLNTAIATFLLDDSPLGGIKICMNLSMGSNRYAAADGVWEAGADSLGLAGMVDVLDTIGNVFEFTGLMLNKGSVAESFEHLPFALTLRNCQRYYEKSYDPDVYPGTITNEGNETTRRVNASESAAVFNSRFVVQKFGTPLMTWYNPVTGASSSIRDNSASINVAVTGSLVNDPPSTKKTGSPSHAASGAVGALITGHWVADTQM